MSALASLAFANPWVLLGLLALPAVWFLVRALPPRPRREAFPPLILLRRLSTGEPPSARTPPWLLLLRLLLAGLLIFALAGPLLNPSQRLGGEGPLLLVLDDGWTAASRWEPRVALIDRLLAKAGREDRPAILLRTAPPPGGYDEATTARLPEPRPAGELRRTLAGFAPRPFAPDHGHAAARIEGADPAPGSVVWISDGLVHSGSDRLETALAALGGARIYGDAEGQMPHALLPLGHEGLDFLATVRRPPVPGEAALTLRALGADGRLLASTPLTFGTGAETARVRLSLPQRVRNAVARIEIAGEASAGAVALLDARAGRPAVGLVGGETGPAIEPLKSPIYYLSRALEPSAEIRRGDLARLLEGKTDVLILADVDRLRARLRAPVEEWLEAGGVLIRFAGPNMAENVGENDPLLPVRLRSGQRAVGGALSWEDPQSLGDFPEDGPFAGLRVPESITVSRQLLAVPAPDLPEKSWARLADGTPLVTAQKRGRGWLVLVHTTADPGWSNLVLSGLFVDMLERLLALAQLSPEAAMVSEGPKTLAPQALLDGFGRLGPAAAESVAGIPAARFDEIAAGPEHPPGLYGPPTSPLALDLSGPNGPIDTAFRFRPAGRGATPIGAAARDERDLAPTLLGIVVALALADFLISLLMRGLVQPRISRRAAAGGIGVLAATGLLLAVGPAAAQPADREQIEDSVAVSATTETRLAYIETGDPEIDRMTRAGLKGLARVVDLRTAVQLGEAMAVDPEQVPLSLFPLVYWPVPADAPALGEAALANLEDFLRSGGIAVFDTGVGDEAGDSLGIQSPAARSALRRVVGPVGLPSLIEADQEHVLGRAFYLMDRFPGRIRGRPVWVAQASGGERPDVSPVIIGAQDWAAAWAIDSYDRFLLPDLPGGRTQRELAFRFGVNLVMYALTGTYKADQLHMPALIERLGE